MLIVVVLAGLAAADRKPDLDMTGVIVVNADGAQRDQALEIMVRQKRLDAKTRALLPTKQVIRRELARLSTTRTKTRTPYRSESCALMTGLGGDLVFRCSERACGGGCQVLRNEATIRVRAGRWAVEATTVKRLGDTGECGCCF